MRVPFAVNSYRHESLPLSAQRVVNWYPEAAPRDAKTRTALLPRPGLKPFTTVGTGPIRGRAVMDGVLYVVSGSSLHSVDASGGVVDFGGIGTNATGMVSLDHNGKQLVVVNDNTGYVYDRLLDTLEQITDPSFQSASATLALDLYHVFVKLNSDEFFLSALADPTTYDALDFATAEGEPDRLVNLAQNARQLFLCGTRTIEPWYNSADTFPFDRISGAYIDKGLGAKFSIVNLDNSLFWLGDDRIVYRLDGFSAQRISTHAIEQAIEGYSGIGDAIGDAFTLKGHAFYVLTFPGQGTWVYDAATRRWHEWQSFGQADFLGCCFADVYGATVVGEREGNRLFTLDPGTMDDAGEPILYEATSAPLYAEGATVRMGNFEIIFETGVGTLSGQGEDPQAMLQYSDDGAKTWSSELWRTIGRRGDYDHVVDWNRLGAFKQRVMRVRVSDPIGPALLGANADIAN